MSYLIVSGRVAIWHVFTAAIINGIIFSIELPTRHSLVIDLVEKKEYASAVSLNSGLFNAARAIGPALAGILIAYVGLAPAFFINGVSFLAVLLSLYAIRTHSDPAIRHTGTVKEGILEAVEYLKSNKILALLLVLLAIMTISTWPTTLLFPVFAHDIYKMGEVGFGLLQSSFGAGAVVSAIDMFRIN